MSDNTIGALVGILMSGTVVLLCAVRLRALLRQQRDRDADR